LILLWGRNILPKYEEAEDPAWPVLPKYLLLLKNPSAIIAIIIPMRE
jgi:hypothetical protein